MPDDKLPVPEWDWKNDPLEAEPRPPEPDPEGGAAPGADLQKALLLEDLQLHNDLVDISTMLDDVLREMGRLQGRIRRLEQRPVITVQHEPSYPIYDPPIKGPYREGM